MTEVGGRGTRYGASAWSVVFCRLPLSFMRIGHERSTRVASAPWMRSRLRSWRRAAQCIFDHYGAQHFRVPCAPPGNGCSSILAHKPLGIYSIYLHSFIIRRRLYEPGRGLKSHVKVTRSGRMYITPTLPQHQRRSCGPVL